MSLGLFRALAAFWICGLGLNVSLGIFEELCCVVNKVFWKVRMTYMNYRLTVFSTRGFMSTWPPRKSRSIIFICREQIKIRIFLPENMNM